MRRTLIKMQIVTVVVARELRLLFDLEQASVPLEVRLFAPWEVRLSVQLEERLSTLWEEQLSALFVRLSALVTFLNLINIDS